MDGTAHVVNSAVFVFVPSGGIIWGDAKFSNGYGYRVPITVPQAAVRRELTDFVLGSRRVMSLKLYSLRRDAARGFFC